jgi:hypothetical protein
LPAFTIEKRVQVFVFVTVFSNLYVENDKFRSRLATYVPDFYGVVHTRFRSRLATYVPVLYGVVHTRLSKVVIAASNRSVSKRTIVSKKTNVDSLRIMCKS